MKTFKRNRFRLFIAMTLIITTFVGSTLTANASGNVYTDENVLNLSKMALQHDIIINPCTYDDATKQALKTTSIAIFNDWASKNLKAPKTASLISMDITDFSFTLAYEDMNPYYLTILNMFNLPESTVKLTDLVGAHILSFEYTAMNSFGGYVRNSKYVLVYPNNSTYICGDASDAYILALAHYSLYYSGNPIYQLR